MFIITDLLLMILISVFSVFTYFIIEKFLSSVLIFKLKLTNIGKMVVEGSLYGGAFLLYSLFLKSINTESGIIPVYVAGAFVITFFKPILVCVLSVFPGMLYQISTYGVDSSTFMLITLLFVSMTIAFILKYFEVSTIPNLIAIFTIIVAALVSLIVNDVLVHGEFTKTSIRVLFVPFFGAFAMFGIWRWMVDFLESANLLYQVVNFNFSRYHRQSLAKAVIGDFVAENNISQAIFGVMDFKFENLSTSEKTLEIQESILMDIQEEFRDDAILFKATQNRCGFFLPIRGKVEIAKITEGNYKLERDDDDSLKYIENICKLRSVSYATSWDEIVPVKIEMGVSLYGIQDNSIDHLMEMAEYTFSFRNSTLNNSVRLFEPRAYHKKLNDAIMVQNMDQKIGLDNFINKKMSIVNLDDNKNIFDLVVPEKDGFTEIKEDLRDLIHFFGWTEVFDKYMAYETVSKYFKNNLAFFYSPKIFLNEFDISAFIEKVLHLGSHPTKITLIISGNQFNEIKNTKDTLDIIRKLKEAGFKIGIFKMDKFSKTELSNINCDSYFLTASHMYNPIYVKLLAGVEKPIILMTDLTDGDKLRSDRVKITHFASLDGN